jgi:hypothetical protein
MCCNERILSYCEVISDEALKVSSNSDRIVMQAISRALHISNCKRLCEIYLSPRMSDLGTFVIATCTVQLYKDSTTSLAPVLLE